MNPYMMPIPEPKEQCRRCTMDCKIKAWLRAMWKSILETPLLVKLVVALIIFCFLLAFIERHLGYMFMSFPYYLFFRQQFYRLITGTFMITQIYNVVIALIVWVPKATKYERSIGTIRYTFLFLINSIAIQLIYNIFTLIGAYFNIGIALISEYERISYYQTVGIIPYALMEMTMDYLANRNHSGKTLCCTGKNHRIASLAIVFTISSLLNWVNIFQMLVGIFYGMLYYYRLREKMYLSDETIAKFENCCLFRCISRKCGFISLKDADEYNMEQIDLARSSIVNNQP